MTDHLAEARRLADKTYWGHDDPHIENLAIAIGHLADVIEELRATLNPELIVRTAVKDCYECETAGRNCVAHPATQSETVPVLLPEHRDREWRDRDGDLWRYQDDGEHSGWLVQTWTAGNEDAPAWCGPFTAVEEA